MTNENDATNINQDEIEITTMSADDPAAPSEIVEALFDDGDSASDVAFADLDHDGTFDAGAADTDGDGQVDTIAADLDGDGHVDAIGVDSDGDGQLDAIGVDTDGDGSIDAVGVDTDGDGTIDVSAMDTDGDGEFDTAMTADGQEVSLDDQTIQDEGLPSDEEMSTDSIEFTVGEDGFPVSDDAGVHTLGNDPDFTGSPDGTIDTGYSVSDPAETDAGYSVEPASEDHTAAAEQQAHADAAQDAQSAADEYIAQGDYAAAAEARETAESEAYAAGDSSMLGSSDSTDLQNAAYHQQTAEEYQQQQADHIAAGDYEAAKADAENAAYHIGSGDYLAGGSDHTGQADQDAYNLGNASWNENQAQGFQDDAAWYAEQGNMDAAESALGHAGDYGDAAYASADAADPSSIGYDVDHSSMVDSGGHYDAGTVDMGHDAGADMSSSVIHDPSMDDGMV